MLRIFSAKIFREDLKEYALPMWAFETFQDVENLNLNQETYKFCLPVSIGDFIETNVPACFSNNLSEIKQFVEEQRQTNHRKAFILSDFGVYDLNHICFSGVIMTDSKKGLYDYYNRSTTIDLTLKNPITTYAKEGISPRDLFPDIRLQYTQTQPLDPASSFPTIQKKETLSLNSYKDILYQAYMASSKIHQVAQFYDGEEYSEYALFFVNHKGKVCLYEIIGEESFRRRVSCEENLIREELNYIACETKKDGLAYTKCKKKNFLEK